MPVSIEQLREEVWNKLKQLVHDPSGYKILNRCLKHYLGTPLIATNAGTCHYEGGTCGSVGYRPEFVVQQLLSYVMADFLWQQDFLFKLEQLAREKPEIDYDGQLTKHTSLGMIQFVMLLDKYINVFENILMYGSNGGVTSSETDARLIPYSTFRAIHNDVRNMIMSDERLVQGRLITYIRIMHVGDFMRMHRVKLYEFLHNLGLV